MSRQISQAEYFKAFEGKEKRKEALNHALDIRKFEIDLYWKRATYFWTFIAATLAGYAALYISSSPVPKTDLLVVLSCLGFVFSLGWFCVNKGSKHWQENWENHVDMLEDDVIGPLYKTIMTRPPSETFAQRIREAIRGPSPFSVSKINQIISLYVTGLWLILMYKALPTVSISAPINWGYAIVIGLTMVAAVSLLTLGKAYDGSYRHIARQRDAEIVPRESGT